MTPREQVRAIADELEKGDELSGLLTPTTADWVEACADRLRAIEWPEPVAGDSWAADATNLAARDVADGVRHWLLHLATYLRRDHPTHADLCGRWAENLARGRVVPDEAETTPEPCPSLAVTNLLAHLEAAAEDARRGTSGSASIPAATLDDWAARLRAIEAPGPLPEVVGRVADALSAVATALVDTTIAGLDADMFRAFTDNLRSAVPALPPAPVDREALTKAIRRAWDAAPPNHPRTLAAEAADAVLRLVQRPALAPVDREALGREVRAARLAAGAVGPPATDQVIEIDEEGRVHVPPGVQPPAEGPCALALRELAVEVEDGPCWCVRNEGHHDDDCLRARDALSGQWTADRDPKSEGPCARALRDLLAVVEVMDEPDDFRGTRFVTPIRAARSALAALGEEHRAGEAPAETITRLLAGLCERRVGMDAGAVREVAKELRCTAGHPWVEEVLQDHLRHVFPVGWAASLADRLDAALGGAGEPTPNGKPCTCASHQFVGCRGVEALGDLWYCVETGERGRAGAAEASVVSGSAPACYAHGQPREKCGCAPEDEEERSAGEFLPPSEEQLRGYEEEHRRTLAAIREAEEGPDDDDEDGPPCESCGEEATGRTLDDVPLCGRCGKELEAEESRRVARERRRHQDLVELAAGSLAGLRAHPEGFGSADDSATVGAIAQADAVATLAAIERAEKDGASDA